MVLLKIKRLVIENEGYKRNIFFEDIYINSSSIISVSNYLGAESFLLREKSEFAKEKFSLIKINEGDRVQEIIAHGGANQIYSSFRGEYSDTRRLLSD